MSNKKEEVRVCCICGNKLTRVKNPTPKPFVWQYGNNAQPLKEGRCCDLCNRNKVIPAKQQNQIGRG